MPISVAANASTLYLDLKTKLKTFQVEPSRYKGVKICKGQMIQTFHTKESRVVLQTINKQNTHTRWTAAEWLSHTNWPTRWNSQDKMAVEWVAVANYSKFDFLFCCGR